VAAGLSVGVAKLGGVPNDIPAAVRRQASEQGGAITRRQAVQAGLSVDKINWLLKRGDWRQVHRGVYVTFTGPAGRSALLWAAVLYAGPGAYLSHETAAEINGLSDDESPAISVTIPASRRVSAPPGVVIRHSSHKAMTWRPPGMPPYTVAEETVIDLAQAATTADDVVALVTRGYGRRLLVEHQLLRLARARKKLRWRRELDEIIPAAAGAHSPLEYRHDRDVQRAHGLPEPVKQDRFRKPDGGWGYRDRCYPEYGRLVIELDGRRFHPDEQRGRDTERDNQAAVAGATLRYGWDDVTRRACETAEQEAAALRNRGWTGTLTPCSPSCRAVNGYGRSARSTVAVSVRSGRTASAPAMARSSAE
jgi:Transcriptional regulator, AbiEi antitoxin